MKYSLCVSHAIALCGMGFLPFLRMVQALPIVTSSATAQLAPDDAGVGGVRLSMWESDRGRYRYGE